MKSIAFPLELEPARLEANKVLAIAHRLEILSGISGVFFMFPSSLNPFSNRSSSRSVDSNQSGSTKSLGTKLFKRVSLSKFTSLKIGQNQNKIHANQTRDLRSSSSFSSISLENLGSELEDLSAPRYSHNNSRDLLGTGARTSSPTPPHLSGGSRHLDGRSRPALGATSNYDRNASRKLNSSQFDSISKKDIENTNNLFLQKSRSLSDDSAPPKSETKTVASNHDKGTKDDEHDKLVKDVTASLKKYSAMQAAQKDDNTHKTERPSERKTSGEKSYVASAPVKLAEDNAHDELMNGIAATLKSVRGKGAINNNSARNVNAPSTDNHALLERIRMNYEARNVEASTLTDEDSNASTNTSDDASHEDESLAAQNKPQVRASSSKGVGLSTNGSGGLSNDVKDQDFFTVQKAFEEASSNQNATPPGAELES